MTMQFSPDFKWGVATSSYQIEGAAFTDGRGVSIWDTFCNTPGKVKNADNGDVACDHYNRFPEDIQIMKALGIDTYRFSLAWPRMFPDGVTREQRGFDFYNRLIDALIAADIEPLITLYHWDLPQALEDQGGWENPAIVPTFVAYAEAAAEAFGDRVKNWVTINEPWCMSWLGYMSGVHAPGHTDLNKALAAAHHSALAHAEATRAMKAIHSDIRTGLALNMTNFRVEDPNHAEIAELGELMDAHLNQWWIEAMLYGRYPQNLVDFYGETLQAIVKSGDMDRLQVGCDFLGVNYYSDSFIGVPRGDDLMAKDGGAFPFPHRSNGASPGPHTDMGWPVTPEGIKHLLVRISQDWPEINDIAVTENGAAYDDGIGVDGKVLDTRRIEYLTSHLENVDAAIAAGAPVKSYFAWSLLDNFEWAEGYEKRFGIVHVDFETLERVPKESAKVYASIISRHGALARVS